MGGYFLPPMRADAPVPMVVIVGTPRKPGVAYLRLPVEPRLEHLDPMFTTGVAVPERHCISSLHGSCGDMIVDGPRGPEIAGTRITIYDIMDLLKYGCGVDEIASDLWIKPEQVAAAVRYIESHREKSDREYALILERVTRPNPPEVEQGRAGTREELQRRLRAHLERAGARDHSVG